MAVVAVLRKVGGSAVRSPLPAGNRRGLWVLATLDVMAAAWMLTAGDWFDATSRVTSIITLGGHHLLVLGLAVVGFAILAVTATMSGGFADVNRLQAILIAIAGTISVVALAGMLSVVALVVGTVLLIALLGRAFVR